MNHAATISDIASELGISKMTVSRALRNTGRVADRTRERVLKAAEARKYIPNAAAMAMTTGQFRAVSLLLGTRVSRSELPAGVLDGIHDALDDRGMSLSLVRMPDEELIDEGVLPNLLKQRHSDGLIIDYTYGFPQRLLDLIQDYGLPSVWLNTDLPRNTVRPDDEQAGYDITCYLLERGHRRIVYVDYFFDTEEGGSHYSHAHRLAGYERAMRGAGLPTQFIGSELSLGQREAHWRDLLDNANRPTAVVGYGETSLFEVLKATAYHRMTVPSDLSICSFAGEPMFMGLQITTALVPEARMGAAAVGMLLRKLARPKTEQTTECIVFDFTAGASTAPAPLQV